MTNRNRTSLYYSIWIIEIYSLVHLFVKTKNNIVPLELSVFCKPEKDFFIKDKNV